MFHNFLDSRLAQEIVARTMRIIDCNVNIMDSKGYIIGSGDPERIGEFARRCAPGVIPWPHGGN